MKSIGRNSSCWCGSGLKYKKCHLDRDKQERANPWDAVEANKKAFNEKKCCAKDIGLGPCEGKIVKAHTVSKGANLSKIARQGKVIRYGTSAKDIKINRKLKPIEIGVGNASVFHGFCAKHDQCLFSCIENEAFEGSPEQCLMVAYRSLSRELYGKEATTHMRDTLRVADKGRPLNEQVHIQLLANLIHHGNELAKKDIKNTYNKLVAGMVSGQHNVLRSLIIEFEGQLPFMLAGAWSPFTDIFGKELQNAEGDDPLEQVFVSTHAGIERSYICFSWVDINNAPGFVIAKQISRISADKQSMACLYIAAKHIENIFYSPNWFDALSGSQLGYLERLVMDGLDAAGSVPSEPMALNLEFSLPCAITNYYR